jgi:PAS domain S-box-containing protein
MTRRVVPASLAAACAIVAVSTIVSAGFVVRDLRTLDARRHDLTRTKQIILTLRDVGGGAEDVDQMQREAWERLRPQTEAVDGATRRTLTGGAATAAAGLLTAVLPGWLIARVLADRRRREKALDRQRRHLHATLESVADGLITTDATGRVTFLNAEAARLTGWSRADAVGRPLEQVFALADARTGVPLENVVLRTFAGSAGIERAGTVLLSRDGRRQPIRDSSAPIPGARGQVVGAVLLFRPAAERVQSDATVSAAVRRSDDHESKRIRPPLRSRARIPTATPAVRHRILIVEPERAAADRLALLLTVGGHDVRSVHTASAALVVGGGFRPSVVLIGTGVPAAIGSDLAQRLREAVWGRDASVLTTGLEGADGLPPTAGDDGHLGAAVDPVDLQMRLRALPVPA